MPYFIKKVKNGFKVCRIDKPNKCFSKKGLSEEKANKQLKAIIISEIGDKPNKNFNKLLEKLNIENELYLNLAKLKAKNNGYNPNLLKFSKSLKHKLNYNGVDFGSSINNDFIIYSIKAYRGLITKDKALEHRKRYLLRAKNIKGDWEKNLESPNNLSINILW